MEVSGSELSASCSSHFTSGKRSPGAQWTGGMYHNVFIFAKIT